MQYKIQINFIKKPKNNIKTTARLNMTSFSSVGRAIDCRGKTHNLIVINWSLVQIQQAGRQKLIKSKP